MPTELFARETKVHLIFQKHRRHVASTSLEKHEQAKFYANRWRNQISGLSAVYQRFISGLSAGRGALFVPGCRPVEQRLYISVNPFHARYVREFMQGMSGNLSVPSYPIQSKASFGLVFGNAFGFFRVRSGPVEFFGFFRILLVPCDSVQVLFRFFRVLSSPRYDLSSKIALMSLKLVESKTRTYHGAGRVGVPGRTAGRGRAGLGANRIVRSIKTLGP